MIVSKDCEFRELAFLHGPPPTAMWMRLGSASTIEIGNTLRDQHDEIERFAASTDEALLIVG